MKQHRVVVTREVRAPADQIVAEAKRWGIEDEVGLQLSDGGVVTLVVSTPRGRQFLQHLPSVLPAPGTPRLAERGGPVDRAALHEIQSAEWLELARWAGEIEAAIASGKRPPAAAVLKLARTVTTMHRAAGTTGIVVRPEGIADNGAGAAPIARVFFTPRRLQ